VGIIVLGALSLSRASNYNLLTIYFIVVGSTVFIVALVGCYAAAKDSSYFLIIVRSLTC